MNPEVLEVFLRELDKGSFFDKFEASNWLVYTYNLKACEVLKIVNQFM